MIQNALSIGLKNTDISKSFNVSRVPAARWIGFHQFCNTLREPEDDNEITELLREMKKHPNVGCRCVVVHLQEKCVKVMQLRLRLILKILKITSP